MASKPLDQRVERIARLPSFGQRAGLSVLAVLGLLACNRDFGEPGLIPQGQANSILRELIPEDEWEAFGSTDWYDKPVQSLFFWGTTASLQGYQAEPQLTVESPEAMRLRHKIIVGTDLREWTILHKDTTYPRNVPFRRSYVLARPDEAKLMGLIVHEGAMLEFFSSRIVGAPEQAAFIKFVTRTSDRLAEVYEKSLKAYAEGPELAGPVPERSDLPDPDLTR